MSKKRKRSVPVAPPKQEKKMVIDMNRMNLKKEHTAPSFRTGGHMTEKDRPRKKDWKREYYRSGGAGRGGGPERYPDGNDPDGDRTGSFLLPHLCECSLQT